MPRSGARVNTDTHAIHGSRSKDIDCQIGIYPHSEWVGIAQLDVIGQRRHGHV